MKTKVLTKQDKVYMNWPFYLAVLISYHSLFAAYPRHQPAVSWNEAKDSLCLRGFALTISSSQNVTLPHRELYVEIESYSLTSYSSPLKDYQRWFPEHHKVATFLPHNACIHLLVFVFLYCMCCYQTYCTFDLFTFTTKHKFHRIMTCFVLSEYLALPTVFIMYYFEQFHYFHHSSRVEYQHSHGLIYLVGSQ